MLMSVVGAFVAYAEYQPSQERSKRPQLPLWALLQ